MKYYDEERSMEKKSKKNIIIICSVIAVLIIAIVTILIVMLGKKDKYRIIKVYEVEGEATVERDGMGEIGVYQDMVLESGDKIVLKSGTMTLKLDEDKYVYVEPETEFKLIASGNSKNSKTSIELSYGAITNEIQNPLSDKSSYEVNTPNSNMAVRGTIYRVYTYVEDGVQYTKASVFEGKVDSKLRYEDNTLSDEVVSVVKGKEVIIYHDDKKTDYVGEPRDIDFSDLPESVIRVLMDVVEEGNDIGITYEDLRRYVGEGTVTVTFMANGKVFGTQIIQKGGFASKPTLSPAASGSWDFDFSKEIDSDTVIEWR